MDLETFQQFKATGDKALAGQLLEENIALVTLLTAQLCGWQEAGDAGRRSLPALPAAYLLTHEEAMQCGRIGFARALSSFDPTKGKIAHYTALWIRATLQSAIGSHHKSRKPNVTFVDIDDAPALGKDESGPIEAHAELEARMRRGMGRMGREERRVFHAMQGADFEPRVAARDLGMSVAALEAAWGPIRRSLASPPFDEELESMRRFLASECILAPGARVTSLALRDAYAVHVERVVSVRRMGIIVSRLAETVGIRQSLTTLTTHGGPFGRVRHRVRGWVGVRLRGSAEARTAA